MHSFSFSPFLDATIPFDKDGRASDSATSPSFLQPSVSVERDGIFHKRQHAPTELNGKNPYFKITNGRLYLYRKVPGCIFFKDLDKPSRQVARIWAKRPVGKAMGIEFNFNDYPQSTSIKKNSSIIGVKYSDGKGTVFLVKTWYRIAINSNFSSHQDVMANLADSGLTYDKILDLKEEEWSEKYDNSYIV